MQRLLRNCTELVHSDAEDETLFLTFEQRSKARYRAALADSDIAWFLPRGRVIRDGDVLRCEDGYKIRVRAADELLTQVNTDDNLLMSRLAYHLGNRHVALQIGPGWLRFMSDPVLADMVSGLGGKPEAVCAPYDPESGAYHSHEHH